EITIGTLAFVYTLYSNVVDPLYSFVWGVRRFYESTADLHSLNKYMKISNDIPDKKGAKEAKIIKGLIYFQNISFTYNKKRIISDFNLLIKPREKVAFVGHSGAGKSTLVKLLFRLYDPDLGKVLIDGKDISNLKQESLRSELSIVPQECILFNDTITNNVSFAKLGASKEDVNSALKAAQLYDFVQGLPDKENTFVGERGIKLSGGERQRLSIARAILAGKKILVLDEATSSLDSMTEFKIQQALDNIMRGRTTIIIAHRLSTILKADKIVVIDKGKISEMGTHDELIKTSGIYAKLWKMQKGGYLRE
ncbi:MAG: ATP-binding cassette domain-containing protein, partial [Candidatus Diapherotrites archaeon]|nr:ATP-binding cassette domain-containing protein [Candidatus Diapherotrites archaeon]